MERHEAQKNLQQAQEELDKIGGFTGIEEDIDEARRELNSL